MTDYTAAPLSTDKIEEFAREALARSPRLENGAIDILKALRQPKVFTIHGEKVLRLNLVPDDQLPEKLAQVWASKDRVSVTSRASLWNRAQELRNYGDAISNTHLRDSPSYNPLNPFSPCGRRWRPKAGR